MYFVSVRCSSMSLLIFTYCLLSGLNFLQHDRMFGLRVSYPRVRITSELGFLVLCIMSLHMFLSRLWSCVPDRSEEMAGRSVHMFAISSCPRASKGKGKAEVETVFYWREEDVNSGTVNWRDGGRVANKQTNQSGPAGLFDLRNRAFGLVLLDFI